MTIEEADPAVTAHQVPGVPRPELAKGWALRPVEITGDGGGGSDVAPADGGPDVALVHAWMNSGHVEVNWQQGWSLLRWHNELATQLGGDHSLPCIVSRDGRELAYVELYRVVRDPLARCYPCDAHDLGVHIAIGDREALGRGLGSSLLRTLAEGLLAADPRCLRVVAEPDVTNAASIGAFAKAGYAREREVALPSKNAALMVFSR